ncbi:hypothetical protein [Pseudomonas sp. 460]|uniref:hypothetical protein n=1 Tax=Pseudomonas sp. 460 TaxID=2485142 RepID=UPI0010496A96|nr:hypothetical protein [Pseudomonas sp. 460]TCV51383.1 hypothetical protein EDB99_10749 [Pseudomonas sp. 460]
MTRILEHIASEVSTAKDLARAALPPALAATVDMLKVGESLLAAMGSIEQAAWEEHLDNPESRANAFAISALIYGDLSHSDWDVLDQHIRDRVAARRAFLRDRFNAVDNSHS